jgi:hypothetical protein
MNESMSGGEELGLEDLRSAIGAFIRERDWEQFHSPKNLAMLPGELLLYRILGNLGTEVAPDFARWHHTDGRPEGAGCPSHGVCTRGGLWGLS